MLDTLIATQKDSLVNISGINDDFVIRRLYSASHIFICDDYICNSMQSILHSTV